MLQDLKNVYHLFVAFLANIYYGFPSGKLTVIGITGTSGKTTTTHMIYEILKEAGYKVSLLSTIKAVIGGKEYDTGFHVTTPDPHVLPKFLKEAVENGDTHFVLEVSSHALDQNRTAFVRFKVGVLTSLAHEHLDYHKTFANYAKEKFKLLHAARIAVLPELGISKETKKDVNYDLLKKKVITFGLTLGSETQKKWQLRPKSAAEFNILNSLAAATATNAIGISKYVIKKALSNFSSIPGRYEEMPTGRDFRVIIDFAHKPDALEQALQAARSELRGEGRIIAMYGCASERDVLKRPMMGKISARLSDITVLTDEDPRRENPMKIINEIADGCVRGGAKEVQPQVIKAKSTMKNVFFKIPNRKEAIGFIIQDLASKGDIILLCGKGHEQSMNYNGIETPWNEHKAVKEALRS